MSSLHLINVEDVKQDGHLVPRWKNALDIHRMNLTESLSKCFVDVLGQLHSEDGYKLVHAHIQQ